MPAAITSASASCGPGRGVSIASTWKAFSGSPKRSGRITWAYIRAGTSPRGGMSPISYSSLTIVRLLRHGNGFPAAAEGNLPKGRSGRGDRATRRARAPGAPGPRPQVRLAAGQQGRRGLRGAHHPAGGVEQGVLGDVL